MSTSHAIPDPAAYAELHCLSNYSFLRGASFPDELVQRAAELGYSALALTDECSVAGVVRAHLAVRDLRDQQGAGASSADFQLIVGSEFRLQDGPRFVLLACDRDGYGDLCQLITRGRRAAQKGGYRLTRADVTAFSLRHCLAIWLPQFDAHGALIEPLEWLAAVFPSRLWIAAELLGRQNDAALVRDLHSLSAQFSLPVVACGDVHMHRRGRRALQDALTAIRLNTPLAELGLRLFANGERHLRPRERLAAIYPPAWIAETGRIAARCRFSLDELRYEYPDELVPDGLTAAQHLRALTEAGARQRFPDGLPERVRTQIEHELRLIGELDYEPYFLTVEDIVRYARSQNILCQGRGSAANSAVCYCLGITAVDPARMSMLFERFVSKERDEPPDIDVDFEHQRREEVIQYIYAKYGRERAALAATVISYRPRSAIRDLGKALGLAADQVDRLSKSMAWWDGAKAIPERMRELGLDPDSAVIGKLLRLLDELLGFPRHLSQHVGGFVISRGPLSRLVPVENAAMHARTVIQWEKDDLEALGLLKIDVLALGMLSAIRRALEMVSKTTGKPLALHQIPAEDPAVYRMISRADTLGLFQIESRAQMAMLPRIQPRTFYDLVIEVAIVRPGPIQGDMVHPYLRRRQGLEPVEYPSEDVRGVLERTLGIPIFQEQVMQLAVVAAGFTAGEADQLRRAMAAWRKRGGLEPFEQRLIDGMLARGYPREFGEAIYRQILGFGEYGFPESHAASFALLVYVSAWLKCHHPAAYCAALLNSQPMGFYAPAQLLRDAREHGVSVLPVNVQQSHWDCVLVRPKQAQEGPRLRLGLRLIKGMKEQAARRIVEQRAQAPFHSVDDLKRRAGLQRDDLEALSAANALRRLAGNRNQAGWQVANSKPELALWNGQDEFRGRAGTPLLPTPQEGDNIIADYASLGLSLGRHPLALIRAQLDAAGYQPAQALWEIDTGRYAQACGLVLNRQRPQSANGVVFLTLEDETGFVNVVVWGDLVERYRKAVLTGMLIGVAGSVQREYGVQHLIAERLEEHNAWLGALKTRSRDFG